LWSSRAQNGQPATILMREAIRARQTWLLCLRAHSEGDEAGVVRSATDEAATFDTGRVVRDLRVYAQAAYAHVLRYRDNTGLEVDAIVEAADGRWAAFEARLGPGQVDEGTATLLKLAERVDPGGSGRPAVLGVTVGFGYGYVRDDRAAVIPIGALRP
jgi:hypothetical protein